LEVHSFQVGQLRQSVPWWVRQQPDADDRQGCRNCDPKDFWSTEFQGTIPGLTEDSSQRR
jgi:hypothetical protein